MNLLSYKLISFKSVPLKMCATQRGGGGGGGGEQSCDLQSRIFNHYSPQCFRFPSQAPVGSPDSHASGFVIP